MNRAALVLNAAFALTGAMTTLLGPLLPALMARWSLTPAQAGRLFAVQFLMSTAAAALGGAALTRIPARWCLAGSYAAMAAAAASLAGGSFTRAAVCVAVYGAALGIVIPAANLAAAHSSSTRTGASALNLLNMCWCAGAVLTPLALAAWLPAAGLGGVLAALAAALLLAAVLSLAFPVRLPAHLRAEPVSFAHLRGSLAPALFLALYVGVENTVAGWLPTFASGAIGLDAGRASASVAAFWAGLMLARGYAAAAPVPPSPRACLWTALGGTALAAASGGAGLLTAGAAIAGAGLGPVFPAVVALQQTQTGAAARTLGPVLATAGCGGAIVPWAAGLAAGAARTERAALFMALFGIAALCAALPRISPSRRSAAVPGA